jgi:hypothetical protein
MNFANDLTNDLKAKIGAVPVGTPDDRLFKPVVVYSVDDLFVAIKNLRPAVGIVYEGARAVPSGVSDPRRGTDMIGVSGEAVFGVLLVTETSVLSQLPDTMTNSHVLLDALRRAIQGTRSPNNHRWKWVVEAPAVNKNSATVWVQRYSCPVQLLPA